MFVPTMMGLADVMAESGYAEEQVFDLGIDGSIVFLVVVPELGACKVPATALSHFMAGAEEYTAEAMPEHYSGTLSGRWTIKRDLLRILPKSWQEWADTTEEIDRLDQLATKAERVRMAAPVTYQMPLYVRLEPRTEWQGSRITHTDILTLQEAATFATKHASEEITPRDFLRAAARGEIVLRAVVHRTAEVQKHDGGIFCNAGQADENVLPSGHIATLPLTACKHLAAAGRASWRTFDGFEMLDGVLQRYTKGHLVAGELDFETVLDDCRVTGYDVHALADAFHDRAPDEPQAAAPASAGPDYAMLATPEKLIEAFGSMSGMNREWFRSMKDRSPLQKAVTVPGVRGRNGGPPLLDVFTVFQYLIDPKRRGKKMQSETGWRLLKAHFPSVYAQHEAYDPSQSD